MPCEMLLSLKEKAKGKLRVLWILMTIVLFGIAPVLVYLVALGYYIYGLVLVSMSLKNQIDDINEYPAVEKLMTLIAIIIFIAISTIPAAVCVVLIGLAIVLGYILFIIMFILMTFQWCISSKRSNKSYITEKDGLKESLLDEEDLEN